MFGQLQHKATNDSKRLAEHAEHYPNIEIIATSEVARAVGVRDSGFSNEVLGNEVASTLDALQGPHTPDQVGTTGVAAGPVSALARTHAVATGKIKAGVAGKGVAKDLGIAVSTSALVDLLFP